MKRTGKRKIEQTRHNNEHEYDNELHWSFYKIILSPTTQFTKLRIPEKFATTFSDELSSIVTLTVPTGVSLNVTLVKDEDGKLWFGDGWREFVEYFSISCAYFLMFTYAGSSNFTVHIFDPTACEISYPCNACNSFRTQNGKPNLSGLCKDKETDGDDNVSLEELGVSSSNTDNSSGVEILDSEDEHFVSDKEMKLHEGSKRKKKENDARHGTPHGRPVQSRNSETEKSLMEAVSAAGISIPENPFFIVAIKQYNLVGRYLYVPPDFASEHLEWKNRTDITIVISDDGQQWQVKFIRSPLRSILSKGLMTFIRQNNLNVGDVCLFELTNAKNCVLKVHIAKKS